MSANLNSEQEKRMAHGIKEVAQLVGVSPAFVRKEISAGNLRRTKLGRRTLIKNDDLLAWINHDDDPRQETEAA